MKKFIAVLAIAGTIVSCNDSADSTQRTKDSLDSVAKAQKDAVQDNTDATKDNIDSTTQLKKDSVEQVDSLKNK